MAQDPSAILAVSLSAITAMLKLQVVIVVGVVLALLHLLTPEIAKGVNKIVFTTFIPCLLFINVGSSLTVDGLMSMSIVAIFCVINIAFGFVVTLSTFPSYHWLGTKFSSAVRSFHCCSKNEFDVEQNIGMHESDGEHLEHIDHLDHKTNFDKELVEKEEAESNKRVIVAAVAFGNATSMPLGLIQGIFPSSGYASQLALATSYASIYLAVSQILLYAIGYSYLSKIPVHHVHDPDLDNPTGMEVTRHTHHSFPKMLLICGKKVISKLLTPPTIGLLAGAVVGLSPPLKRLFFNVEGETPLFEEYPSVSPPLEFLTSAIQQLGQLATPLMLLSLGNNLSKGPGGSNVPKAELAYTAFVKLIVCPAFGILSVGLANYLGLIENEIMHLVLLIVTATPTAISLLVILSILGKGEEKITTILFYEYLLSIVTMTGCLIVFFILTESPENLELYYS